MRIHIFGYYGLLLILRSASVNHLNLTNLRITELRNEMHGAEWNPQPKPGGAPSQIGPYQSARRPPFPVDFAQAQLGQGLEVTAKKYLPLTTLVREPPYSSRT